MPVKARRLVSLNDRLNTITKEMASKFLRQFEADVKASRILASSKIYVNSTSGFEIGSTITLGSITRWQRIKMFFGQYKPQVHEVIDKTESYLQITPIPSKEPDAEIPKWGAIPKPQGDTIRFSRPQHYN